MERVDGELGVGVAVALHGDAASCERDVGDLREHLAGGEGVRGGAVDFRTLSLQPRQFLGHPGFQFDYEHLDGDELWRKGRAVGAVINGRLYLIMLDAARSHYFPDALRDMEAMVASARLVG